MTDASAAGVALRGPGCHLEPADISGHYGPAEAYVDGELIGNWVDSFSWVGHDWLGTKRYESGGYGSGTGAYPTFVHSDTSLPFGDATVSTPATDYDPLHFTGKEKDADTGDDYFGARYYTSGMGRFMSPDWAAKAEPVPYAKLDDPQSLNLYGYARTNPTSGVDPEGHTGGKGDFTPDCDTGIITQCSQGTQAAAASQQQEQQQAQQTNEETRATIASAAKKHEGSADWAHDKKRGSFGCNTWKCNLFVGDVAKEAGAAAEVNGRYPTAGEWVNKGAKIAGWRVLKAGEAPAPGDVAAYKIAGCHGCTGHSGIVVGVDSNGVHVMAAHYDVIGPDEKFQPTNPAVVYRRFTGDE